MAKSREKKSTELSNLTALLKDAKGIVFADYTGLGVKDMQELRRGLRKAGITYDVIKKTLLQKALSDSNLASVSLADIQSSVSVAVSAKDEVEPAREVAEFAKTHADKFKVLGGVLEANFIPSAKVLELAKLPSKQQLLGQLVGTLAAPMSGFANVLQGNLRGLVQVLKAKAEKIS